MIPKFKKILFSTDLSGHARYAFNYAASLAAFYRAGIVILHVMDEEAAQSTQNMLSVFLGSDKLRELEDSRSEAQDARSILIGKKQEALVVRDALSFFYENAKNELDDLDIPADEIIVKKGDVAKRIISVAKEHDCDLIVMGHGKYNVFMEAVLGSTTKNVLKKSTIPVLVIPMPAESKAK